MMNYSDYDSDGYSSNEDADYVPSDDNLSEDDLNDCEPEEPLDGEGQAEPLKEGTKKRAKKSKGKDITARKRKKVGLKLEGEEEAPKQEEEEKEVHKEEEEASGQPDVKEEKSKKKADDLWASFLSDVGQRPKATTQSSTAADEKPESTESSDKSTTPAVQPEATKDKAPSKVTITKVFDFAGEEVRVTKEVAADSREAKSYLKKDESEAQSVPLPRPSVTSPGPAAAPGPSVKRAAPGGMGSVLSRLGGKKQKMSTLEKSKLDWDTFKDEEGIGDELAIHNRGREGYVERMNFLERVDQRQFQLEKTVRLNNMKR
ncbi:craniofacial development protein 1 [Engraulis encrasicolus]|uniref:craniofacial development protein 1 n=1 Tax=Engraulis encrasicolus TaxID=184585 RepID=UPI002FD59D6E